MLRRSRNQCKSSLEGRSQGINERKSWCWGTSKNQSSKALRVADASFANENQYSTELINERDELSRPKVFITWILADCFWDFWCFVLQISVWWFWFRWRKLRFRLFHFYLQLKQAKLTELPYDLSMKLNESMIFD